MPWPACIGLGMNNLLIDARQQFSVLIYFSKSEQSCRKMIWRLAPQVEKERIYSDRVGWMGRTFFFRVATYEKEGKCFLL